MSTYPLEMGDLLLTMKQKASDDQTILPFLGNVLITAGGWYPTPWHPYTLYLTPLGSPETELTETGEVWAEHTIMMEAVIVSSDPGDEGIIIGRDETNVGITEFVSRVLQFFRGNPLGLENSGMMPGWEPRCHCPRDGYSSPVKIEDDDSVLWLLSGRMEYRARTRPF